jgi:hypothetical protein
MMTLLDLLNRFMPRSLRPSRKVRGILMTLLLISLSLMDARLALAQDTDSAPNRAGLVVVYEDGSTISRCVGFDEESISGYELLVRGNFAPRSEITSVGTTVCSLDGHGCGDGEDCFCQCQSSTCRYWTYWQQLPEGWRYSNAGAATVQVRDRDVQGWVWGESRTNSAAENAPPNLAFSDICTTDAELYGRSEDGAAHMTGYGIEQQWLAAFVVGVPLLAGGVWWLIQRRKAVQP